MSKLGVWKGTLLTLASMLTQGVAQAQTPTPTNPPIIKPPQPPVPVKDINPVGPEQYIGSCDANVGKGNPAGCQDHYMMGRGWREPSDLREGGWLICSRDGWTKKHVRGDCLAEVAPDRLSIWAKCTASADFNTGEGGYAYYLLSRVHMVLKTDAKDLNENCDPTAAPTGPQPEKGSIIFAGCSIPPHAGIPYCTTIGDPQEKQVSCPPNVGVGFCTDNPNPPDDQGLEAVRKNRK